MIKGLFHGQLMSPPQVILLFTGCYVNSLVVDRPWSEHHLEAQAPTCMLATKQLMQALPDEWSGTVYLSNGFIQADSPMITATQHDNYLSSLRWFDIFLNDTRARLLDLYPLTSGMRLYAERPSKIRSSTHHHRWCSEDKNGDLIHGDMRVCSNVTEVLANLLIGRAVAPLGKEHWKETIAVSTAKKTTTTRELQVCTDCPLSLLPMHIKVDPDLQCTNGPFTAVHKQSSVGAAWNTPPCPADCQLTDSVGQKTTGSGPVEVRVCLPNSTDGSLP